MKNLKLPAIVSIFAFIAYTAFNMFVSGDGMTHVFAKEGNVLTKESSFTRTNTGRSDRVGNVTLSDNYFTGGKFSF